MIPGSGLGESTSNPGGTILYNRNIRLGVKTCVVLTFFQRTAP